jgi:TolA-binding protein
MIERLNSGDGMNRQNNICAVLKRQVLVKTLLIVILAGFLSIFTVAPSPALASIPNRLQRVDIRPKKGYTRIVLGLKDVPTYKISALAGNRLRISIEGAEGPLFKKFRNYSDTNIGGLLFSRRGTDLLVTFQTTPGAGWRELQVDGGSSITLDVGGKFRPPLPGPSAPGREKIWSGVEKLVRDFDPPLKSDIPFQPTDRQILKSILDTVDQQIFMEAEAALYKGRLTEAEEGFSPFAVRQAPIKSLALYRLGETWYKLQKYTQALAAFREAEKIWPAYLNYNPSITFYYGDSIVRSGDLTAGRILLSNLIGRLADKKFAPTLLVRLGDILARQGQEQESLALYRTVAENFKNNKARYMAQIRLNDREFLQATAASYRSLGESYQEIALQSGDFEMREESHFKYVLLESLHGEAAGALQVLTTFQRKFPRGVYTTVVRVMREVLVGRVYKERTWDKDAAALIRFVEEHQEYLAACVELPGFLEKVAVSYTEAGRPIELIKLFSYLVERQWSTTGVPYMYEEIANNAELIGDVALAESSLRNFSRKYPAHPRVRLILERLGGLCFTENKHRETRDALQWLLNKGERALKSESYYYLGRSLWSLKEYSLATKAIDRYLVSAGALGGRLLPDAYFIAVSSRESLGDRKGALRLLEAGLKLPGSPRSEEFLYKSGEMNLLEGKKHLARSYFEQIVTKGKDPDWQKLAQQALESLDGAKPR